MPGRVSIAGKVYSAHDLYEAAAKLEQACVEGVRDTSVDDMVHKVSKVLDGVIDELRTLESARVS